VCQAPRSIHIYFLAALSAKRFDRSADELEVSMERGLLAPLSPNELTALMRVANGISKPKHLRSTSVERLKRLALVEESDGRIRLTPLGRQRCLADRSPPGGIAPPRPAA
jgi:hypothetical protein